MTRTRGVLSSSILLSLLLFAGCGDSSGGGEDANNDAPNNDAINNDTPNNDTPNNDAPNNDAPNNDAPNNDVNNAPNNDVNNDAPTRCNIFQQDCPQGLKCVPDPAQPEGRFENCLCVAVNGDGQPGDACTFDPETNADSCGADSYCFGGDAASTRACAPFCRDSKDDPQCPPGTGCLISRPHAVCLDLCDPLVQDCPEGEACRFVPNDTNLLCLFDSGAEIPLGEPCASLNSCAEGLICLDGPIIPDCLGSTCCAELCDTEAPAPTCAQEGTQCVPLFEEGIAPPGHESLGVCILPLE